jgi:drug/metabolite transporter (DMT)-like permease
MSWLLVTISFYLILAVVFLVDKYLLVGLIPDAKVFTFYVGALGILSLVLAPFVGFRVPDFFQIALAVFGGAVYIFALFWFYKSLQLFEASRVVPAVSGLVPLFTFGMVYVFSLGKEVPSLPKIAAFVLLILGTFLIIAEEQKFLNLKSLELSAICAFLLALSFVLFKYVYLAQPFWSGFIWTRIGGFLAALCFLFFGRGVRREIFQRKLRFEGKTTAMGFFSGASGLSVPDKCASGYSICFFVDFRRYAFLDTASLGRKNRFKRGNLRKNHSSENSGHFVHWRRNGTGRLLKMFKKILKMILLIFLVIFLLLFCYFFVGKPEPAEKITWGINFSQKHAQNLGLDWKELGYA